MAALVATISSVVAWAENPPLLETARYQNAEAVELLLASGADPDTRQNDGATALHWAAYQEDADMLAALVQAGANVASQCRMGSRGSSSWSGRVYPRRVGAVKRGASKTPRRGRKGDKIIAPGASREQIMCDMAVVAFDRTALERDRKWGIDRLVDLVTPDMAIKYGQALARMNEAISDGSNHTLAQGRANDCVRFVQAMNRVAT